MHDTGGAPHRTGDPTSLSARVTDWQSAMTSCLIRAGLGRLFSRSPTPFQVFLRKRVQKAAPSICASGFYKKKLRMLNYKGILNYLFLPQSRPDYSIKWLTNPSAFWNVFPNGLIPIFRRRNESHICGLQTTISIIRCISLSLFPWWSNLLFDDCFLLRGEGGNVNHIGQHLHGSWNKFSVRATLSLTENMFGWWNAHRQPQFIIQTALWKKKNSEGVQYLSGLLDSLSCRFWK